MSEKSGGWRWDDAQSIFDEDFADQASHKEGDWKQRERDAKRAAGIPGAGSSIVASVRRRRSAG